MKFPFYVFSSEFGQSENKVGRQLKTVATEDSGEYIQSQCGTIIVKVKVILLSDCLRN